MYTFSSITRILLFNITIILLLNPSFVRTQEANKKNYDIIHETVDITALIFGHINLIACSFVIYSAYVKWRTSCLSISSRVPLYLSISDIFQYPLFMPNFFYSLINHKVIPKTPCKLLAYLLFLQINLNMILMASIALVTYLRVVKSKTMNLGKYDWKFFMWIIVASIFFSTPSIPSLGASKFWCLTSTKPANTLLINAYVIFAMTFLTTCYCYFKTLATIYNVDQEEISDSAGRIHRRNRLERQATRKILIYVLIFTKWIPLLLFGICMMFNLEELLWIDISMIIAFNLGGICNCILYLLNEYSNHSLATYTLEVDEGQEVDPSSHQLSQSFNHFQQTNSSTNSITLVTSALTIEESTGIIDLKTFGNERLLSGNNEVIIEDARNRGDKNKNKNKNKNKANNNDNDNDNGDKDKDEDENGGKR